MGATIIRHAEWDEETVYSLDFLYRERLSEGFSFPCDRYGIVDRDMPLAAKENLRKCLDGTYDVIVQGILENTQNFKIPALARCECGQEFELTGDTVCPRCDREYNSSGQLLADRSLWGEETGERF